MLAEAYAMIMRFQTMTRANKRSPWDTLHPGRKWAAATEEDVKTPEQIERELKAHLTAHLVYGDVWPAAGSVDTILS